MKVIKIIIFLGILGLLELVNKSGPLASLRDYALRESLDHIRYEDEETHGICIGPVRFFKIMKN